MTDLDVAPVDILQSEDRVLHLVCCSAPQYPRPYTSLCGLQLWTKSNSTEMCAVCKDLGNGRFHGCPDGHVCPYAGATHWRKP